MRKSEVALLLESHVGQRYDAIVTGSTTDGIWVRIFTPPADGKLVAGEGGLKVGDKLRVKLVATNVERGFIDFVTADGPHLLQKIARPGSSASRRPVPAFLVF